MAYREITLLVFIPDHGIIFYISRQYVKILHAAQGKLYVHWNLAVKLKIIKIIVPFLSTYNSWSIIHCNGRWQISQDNRLGYSG